MERIRLVYGGSILACLAGGLVVHGQAGGAAGGSGVVQAEPVNPAPVGSEANPMRVSGGVIAGSILHKGYPVYSKIAREQHISGAVVLGVLIDPEGRVQKVTVISGPEALREAYVEAVRQWTYRPFLLNGEPVFVKTTITMNICFGAG